MSGRSYTDFVNLAAKTLNRKGRKEDAKNAKSFFNSSPLKY